MPISSFTPFEARPTYEPSDAPGLSLRKALATHLVGRAREVQSGGTRA